MNDPRVEAAAKRLNEYLSSHAFDLADCKEIARVALAAADAVTQYERVGWYAKVGGADWWRGSRFSPTSIEGMEWEPVFRQVPRAETETP